jgi:type IV pilus assembly protein PilM
MIGSKSVIGLDIGSDSVKAVQLRRRGNTLELERFGVAPIHPNGSPGEVGGASRELKIAAARRAIADGKCTAKYAATAVGGEAVIVRYIQLPEMPEADLRNALRWEAEEYIPYHIDEVNIDSVVLGRSAEPGKLDVLLVCAKKDLINDHVAIVRSLGLTPLIVDVDSFAFMNYFEELYKPSPDRCVALANIGAEVTSINIYVGGTSRFSRDISIAGNAITLAISQKAGLPMAKAEEVKRQSGAPLPEAADLGAEEESSLISSIRGTVEKMTGGVDSGGGLESASTKATRNVLTNLVTELRRSIQYFENQGRGVTVQRLYVGGGTSRMPNLQAYLAQELQLEVEVIDPFSRIAIGSGVNETLARANAENLGVGIGLALRKVG